MVSEMLLWWWNASDCTSGFFQMGVLAVMLAAGILPAHV